MLEINGLRNWFRRAFGGEKALSDWIVLAETFLCFSPHRFLMGKVIRKVWLVTQNH